MSGPSLSLSRLTLEIWFSGFFLAAQLKGGKRAKEQADREWDLSSGRSSGSRLHDFVSTRGEYQKDWQKRSDGEQVKSHCEFFAGI